MDYKRIEQLLERYWQCETSIDEENELRAFFTRGPVPNEWLEYRDLFVYQSLQQADGVSSGFDERVLKAVEGSVVKIKKTSFAARMAPLFRAAAVVVVLLGLSNMVQRSLFNESPSDYNYDAYTDTYSDPEVAYEKVSSALMILSEGLNKSQAQNAPDSLQLDRIDRIDE